jgi:hypothetical protein
MDWNQNNVSYKINDDLSRSYVSTERSIDKIDIS